MRVAHAALEQQLERLHELLTGDAAASVLVTGEHGVGKTVLIDLLAQRLQAEGWLVFEASAAEVLSGQSYIGELEERVREMLAVLDRPRALWRAPEFFDLLAKGSHSRDPRGLLDLVLPAIERGRLRVIGEITPRQLAQLLVARPVIKHHFELLNLMPLEPAALAPLAAQWARIESERLGREVAGERTLAEAARMAAQYFPEQHEPGACCACSATRCRPHARRSRRRCRSTANACSRPSPSAAACRWKSSTTARALTWSACASSSAAACSARTKQWTRCSTASPCSRPA
nr:helicase HerA-like domain-containing protein [Lysobacter enzymogenes]